MKEVQEEGNRAKKEKGMEGGTGRATRARRDFAVPEMDEL